MKYKLGPKIQPLFKHNLDFTFWHCKIRSTHPSNLKLKYGTAINISAYLRFIATLVNVNILDWCKHFSIPSRQRLCVQIWNRWENVKGEKCDIVYNSIFIIFPRKMWNSGNTKEDFAWQSGGSSTNKASHLNSHLLSATKYRPANRIHFESTSTVDRRHGILGNWKNKKGTSCHYMVWVVPTEYM